MVTVFSYGLKLKEHILSGMNNHYFKRTSVTDSKHKTMYNDIHSQTSWTLTPKATDISAIPSTPNLEWSIVNFSLW